MNVGVKPEAFYFDIFGKESLKRIQAAIGAAEVHEEFHLNNFIIKFKRHLRTFLVPEANALKFAIIFIFLYILTFLCVIIMAFLEDV